MQGGGWRERDREREREAERDVGRRERVRAPARTERRERERERERDETKALLAYYRLVTPRALRALEESSAAPAANAYNPLLLAYARKV